MVNIIKWCLSGESWASFLYGRNEQLKLINFVAKKNDREMLCSLIKDYRSQYGRFSVDLTYYVDETTGGYVDGYIPYSTQRMYYSVSDGISPEMLNFMKKV